MQLNRLHDYRKKLKNSTTKKQRLKKISIDDKGIELVNKNIYENELNCCYGGKSDFMLLKTTTKIDMKLRRNYKTVGV